MNQNRIVSDVEEFIKSYHLAKDSDKFLISFSTGADSVAAYSILKTLYPNADFILVYFNHGLRNVDHEIDFCKSLKSHNKVKIKKIPVTLFSKKHKCSIEMAGRKLRYSLLQHYATLWSCTKIVTAHHHDDTLESLLLQMKRHKNGQLNPIFYHRALSSRLDLIRPLLSISKSDIYSYLKQNALLFYEDETNRELRYERNKIRLRTIPNMRERSPALLEKMNSYIHLNRQYSKEINKLFSHLPDNILVTHDSFILTQDIFRFFQGHMI